MNNATLLVQVAEVLRKTFPFAAAVEITAQTTADDVDGWDSLSHALFVMNIERAFALRFGPADVIDLENVGDLVRLVAAARAVLPRMPKLIVYGNCQSAALFEVLKQIPEISSRWNVVHHELWAAGETLDRALADFDDCEVLVQQDVRNWRTHPLHDKLPAHIRVVRFPFCYVGALWPFDGHQNGNDPGWRCGEGEAQFGFTDNLLARLRPQFPDPEERFAHYRDLDLPDIVDIARYAELEEARLLHEDARLGSTLGRFIVDNYRTTRLFHAITHPTPPLLTRIAAEVVAKLGLDDSPFADKVLDYLAYYQVPIHPHVAAALGLQWFSPHETYNFQNRERLDFATYYRRYIRVYG